MNTFRMSGTELREILGSTTPRSKAHKAAKAEITRRAEKRASKVLTVPEPVEVLVEVPVAGEPVVEPEPELTAEERAAIVLKTIRKWASEDAAAFAAEHAGPGEFVRMKITKRAELIETYTLAALDAGELVLV